MRCAGVADEPHPAGAQVGQPAERIDHRAVGRGVEGVQREVAPRRVLGESSVKATTAWRPKVSTSRRKVVTSKGRPRRQHRDRAVLDPGRHRVEPGGLGRAPITASGRASVAMSMSATGRPSSALRTQPPTKSTRCPPAVSAARPPRVGRRTAARRASRRRCGSRRRASGRRACCSIRAVAPQM